MYHLTVILVYIMLLTNNCHVFAKILTTNIAELIPDDDVRRLVQDFGRLCEGTFLCNLNVSVPEIYPVDGGFMIPCCEQCRCDDACHVSNDCCPDIISHVLESSEVERKYDSLVECVQTQYFPKPLTEVFIKSYEMVAKCPSSYKNKDLKERCEKRFDYFADSSEDFTDIVPVADNATEVSFKNVYCAVCNDITEDDVIKWGTNVVCTTNRPFNVDYTENVKKALHDRADCYLEFSPPGSMPTSAAKKKACDYLIDRCNMTGLFYPEDPFLKKACASYTSVYRHYKNVHCYLCNGNSEESLEEKCLLPNYGTMVGFEGTFTFDHMPSGIKPRNLAEKCDSDSVYDKHTNTCRPVFCSGTMWLSERRCTPSYTKAYPVSYRIRFRLIPRQEIVGIDSVFSLYDRIVQKLSKNGHEMLEICVLEMLTKLNITEMQLADPVASQSAAVIQVDIKATFFPEGGYQTTTIENKLQDVLKIYRTDFTDSNNFIMEHIVDETYIYGNAMEEGGVIELKILQSSISGRLLVYIVNKDDTVSVKNGKDYADFHCAFTISISHLQMCAKVVLSNDSFISVLDANLVSKIKVLGEIVETNNFAFTPDKSKLIMCVEQYLHLVEKKEERNQPNAVKENSEEIDGDIQLELDTNKPVSQSGKLCAMQMPVLFLLTEALLVLYKN